MKKLFLGLIALTVLAGSASACWGWNCWFGGGYTYQYTQYYCCFRSYCGYYTQPCGYYQNYLDYGYYGYTYYPYEYHYSYNYNYGYSPASRPAPPRSSSYYDLNYLCANGWC